MVMPSESTEVPVGCGLVDVLVVDHPLAQSRLTAMRDERTDAGAFRAALHELTTMLVYEAARSFPVEHFPVTDAGGDRRGHPAGQPAAARAGAAGRPRHGRRRAGAAARVVDGLRRPGPRRGDLRAARLHGVAAGATWPGIPVLVLDPMLATGGSLEHCCRLLADRGCTDITVLCVLAAPDGHRPPGALRPAAAHRDRVDRRAAQRASMFIVPGLGDAGDRQFGGMPRF